MNERGWSAAALTAMVVMAGLLVFQLIVPVPKPATPQKRAERQTGLERDIESLRGKVTEAKAVQKKFVWQVPADALGAQAMAFVNKIADTDGLKVTAFRPQRTQEGAGLVAHPYLIALEGPYPNVVQFVRTMETPATKLSVVTVQIASADGATDAVNATVGVIAFRELEKERI